MGQPYYFLAFSFLGLAGCQSKIPILCLGSTMLVMLANGSIYSASTYFMDENVKRKYFFDCVVSMAVHWRCREREWKQCLGVYGWIRMQFNVFFIRILLCAEMLTFYLDF